MAVAATAILGVVGPHLVRRTVDRLRAGGLTERLVVLIPEVEAWRFAEAEGVEVWPCGEEHLEFDADQLSDRLIAAGIGEVVIPLGFPRRQLVPVVRWLAVARNLEFCLQRRGVRICWRPAVITVLLLTTFLVRAPVSVVLRSSRMVDGAAVVAAAWAARLLPRRRRPADPVVCHVITHVGTGGAQRQLLEYLRWAARTGAGARVRVLALFGGNRAFLAAFRKTGIAVEVIEDRFDPSLVGRACAAMFPYLSAVIALTSCFFSLRPACTFSWLFLANVAGGIAGRTAGVPRMIASERTLNRWKAEKGTGGWWFRCADRVAAALWDVVVANSAAAADDFAAWTGLERSTIQVIRNGFDFDALQSAVTRDVRAVHGIEAGECLVLTVGRLSPEKNHELLLRATATLAASGRNLRLVIAGHGPLEETLIARAEELGIAHRVVFAGRVDDPQSYYRAADLFVLPSVIESLPNALIEAQALGVAAVTNDVGAAAEIVADGGTGLVVPVGDDQAFIRALAELVADADRRSAMAAAAPDRVRQRFAIERMGREIEAIASAST